MKSYGLFFVFLTLSSWVLADDPSSKPIPKHEGRSGERYRIIGDFNADGIEDMALSIDISLFGNAGGHFEIFLREESGDLKRYDSVFLNPHVIAIEKHEQTVRLWIYHRGGGWLGSLGYYEIEKEGLSQFKGIVIHPGDSGTTIGRALYEAVFNNSQVMFKVEKSQTENGIVHWIAF